MSEQRYGYKTVGELLGLSVGAVAYRVQRLGISGHYGFTLADVEKIRDYEYRRRGGKHYGTNVESLRKAMEEKNNE